MKLDKILEKLIWADLIFIMLVPIYLDSDFFFPYIFSKALAFRILVEILLLLWFGYIYLKKEKINPASLRIPTDSERCGIKIDWLNKYF